MEFQADPCIYFKWTTKGIVIWASWVDDLLSCGNKDEVLKGHQHIKKYFDLDKIGELNKYVGCKIEYQREKGWMKMTQPVLIQSLDDEFNLEEIVGECATPAAPGSTLEETDQVLEEKRHTNYRKGVGKLIHVAKYSRPTISNACLLYTSPSPRDLSTSRMPSSA